MTEPTPITVELAALRKIVTALKPLDVAARYRVITWAQDRFLVPPESMASFDGTDLNRLAELGRGEVSS